MALIDPAFGVSNFKTVKLTSESETIVNNILTLLFMKPGSYPSIPHLGIHIQDYLYQFFDDINTSELTSMIAAQCEEFIPSVNSGQLSVIKTTTKTGKGVLILKLPAMIDDDATGVAVAISTDDNGNVRYNTMIDRSLLS